MRGGATEVNETEKRATSKKWLRITVLENTVLRKLDLFPSSGEGWETPALFRP
jgi:hypothetical protein